MKTNDLLLIGGAFLGYFYLTKGIGQVSAAGGGGTQTDTSHPATAATSLKQFTDTNADKLTTSQKIQLNDYSAQLAQGADVNAIKSLVAQAVANPNTQVRTQAEVLRTTAALSTPSTQYNATTNQYYNPYTGVSYTPRRY